ncbi:MAG: DoxX family membrane protein [Planctomycetes bacterium]|nr:DoxX family membrane protein [Planctomycetota bacterium]
MERLAQPVEVASARATRARFLVLLARAALGGVFIYMGLVKVADPVEFLQLLHQYPAMSGAWVNSVVVILPWLETLCGVAILLGVVGRAAAIIAVGMLVAFTPLVAMRGLEIYREAAGTLSICDVEFDCGCGAGSVALCSKMLENAVLTSLALIAIFARSQFLCLQNLWTDRTAQQAGS